VTPEELFFEWGAAWVTRDHAERLRRLETCTVEDVEFTPPFHDRPISRGRANLAAYILDYTSDWPAGMSIELVAPPETHHTWSKALVRWKFPDLDAIGCDIIRIDQGKIASMLVFNDTGLWTDK
jgi:hypothetical protein